MGAAYPETYPPGTYRQVKTMFKIRRLGTDGRHGGDFRVNRAAGYDCWLFLFVKTDAVFTINGEDIIVKPDSYILYKPGTPHYYKALGDIYVNDWIQFESDTDMTGAITDKPVCVGKSILISSYVQLMCEAFYKENHKSCGHLLSAMLAELSFAANNSALTGPHSYELAALRKELYERPGERWSINSAAERLYISGAHFQELYKRAFGISFGADVIKCRTQAAAELLLYTDMTVSEIGYRCGYASSVHFSRQFSKQTGLSPSEMRKRNRG